MLVAPSALLLGLPNSALATCAVTSGGGTVAIPADGSTVTCVTNATTTSQIGDGTTDASVVLEDGHVLDRSGGGQNGIRLNNVTVTLGTGAQINADIGIYSYNGNIAVTLGQNAQINTTGNSLYSYNGFVSALTLDAGATIQTNGLFINGVGKVQNATLAINSSISALGLASHGLAGTGNTDTIDSAGTISGTDSSVSLRNGDDFLILRTGSNLSSPNGADMGGGTDTVTLLGTNSEDENFLNVESLQMNGVDWTLSGNSLFGTVDINSGILRNKGTMTTDVNIHAGGTFGGHLGVVVGNVSNDGTIAPSDGGVTGLQTIAGNFVQNAGGELEIEFNSGAADLLNIVSTATLDGTVRFVELVGGIADGTIYTFLQTTAGIAGNFSNIQGPLFFNPVVAQVGNNMQVTLNRIAIASSPSAATSNQQSVASAIDAVLASDPASIASVDSLLNNAGSIEKASNILASQAGLIQSASISSSLSAMGHGHGIVSNRLSHAAGGPSGLNAGDDVAASDEGAVWAQATRSFGDIDSDSNARGADYHATGLLAGSEKYLDNDRMIGAFGGFSVTKTDLEDLQDEATTKTLQLGAYASKEMGNWRYSGSLSAAHLDFDTERPTPAGTANAEFRGYGGFAAAEVAYDLLYQGWTLSPHIGLEASTLHHEGYRESGAGALNLAVGSQTTSQLKSILGLGVTGDLALGRSFTLTPTARIAWAHEFADRSGETSANFASAPAIAFQSQGPEKDRDEARLHLDLLAKRLENPGDDFEASLYAAYDATLAASHQNHALTAGLKFKW